MVRHHRIEHAGCEPLPQSGAVGCIPDRRAALRCRVAVGDLLGGEQQVVRAGLRRNRDPVGSSRLHDRQCSSAGKMGDVGAPAGAPVSYTHLDVYKRQAAANSATLVGLSGVIGSVIGVTLGAVVALRKDSLLDHTSSVIALAVTALPEFVVAIAMIIMFATVVWDVLPAVSVVPPGTQAWAEPRELILPVATLVVVIVPYIFRMTRAATVEALASDYAEMARLKGLPTWRVLAVHALPNAIAPVVQVIGLSFLYLSGGIVVVEFVFAFPRCV